MIASLPVPFLCLDMVVPESPSRGYQLINVLAALFTLLFAAAAVFDIIRVVRTRLVISEKTISCRSVRHKYEVDLAGTYLMRLPSCSPFRQEDWMLVSSNGAPIALSYGDCFSPAVLAHLKVIIPVVQEGP